MAEETEKFLPLGSLVLLKNGQKKMMIIGFGQIDLRKKDQIYDYCGCVYPQGIINNNHIYLFNHEDIKEVINKGFNDSEWDIYNKKLKEKLKEINNKE